MIICERHNLFTVHFDETLTVGFRCPICEAVDEVEKLEDSLACAWEELEIEQGVNNELIKKVRHLEAKLEKVKEVAR